MFAGNTLNKSGPHIHATFPISYTISGPQWIYFARSTPFDIPINEESLYGGYKLSLPGSSMCISQYISPIYVLLSTILQLLACPSSSDNLLKRCGWRRASRRFPARQFLWLNMVSSAQQSYSLERKVLLLYFQPYLQCLTMFPMPLQCNSSDSHASSV